MKKPKISSATHESSSVTKKLVINLTSPKGAKMIVEPELVKPTAPKVTASIAEKLVQRKSSVTPPVSRFVSKRPSGAKSGSSSDRLTAMKSGNVDSAAKVMSGLASHSDVIESSIENGKSARTGSCERSTKSKAGEFLEVCALLKADLLEDVDACAKFIESVGKVVIHLNSFAKCFAYSMKSSLIAIMYKTLILATGSMRIDQDAVKYAKETEVALVAQLRSAAERIKKLESELAVLKGSDVSALTSL
ncbi:hypothetical protein ACFX2J_012792 [Malus domestica]